MAFYYVPQEGQSIVPEEQKAGEGQHAPLIAGATWKDFAF